MSFIYILSVSIRSRNTRADILLEAAIVAARDDFAKQVSQIVSRLDNIENELKNIKDKLNIS